MKKVKVAIIGHGHLGKWHAQKAELLENSELVAIVEPNEKVHKEIQKIYPKVFVTKSLEEALPLFEAGVVATPTSFHYAVVAELLKQQKHVFCEKPLCSSKEEAQKILEIYGEQASHLKFQVGHSERYHKVWEKFKKDFSLEKNALIQIQRTSPFKGRATDVDVVQDLMIHDLDLLFFLLGEEIESIEGMGIKNLSSFYDDVGAFISLKKGNKAWIRSSRNSCQELRSFSLSSQNGEVFIDLMNLAFERRNAKGEVVEQGKYEKRDHLLEEQKAFYEAILNDREVAVSLDDGVRAVEAISQVLKAVEKNR